MNPVLKHPFGRLMAAALFIMLIVACGPATPVDTTPTSEASTELSTTDLSTFDGEVEIETLLPGNGRAPQVGEVVGVHYIVYLEDKTPFDESYSRNEPLVFVLGQGLVIPGWELAVLQMTENERAKVTIPPELAFGEAGIDGLIPPNSTLIMDMELAFIKPGAPASPTEIDEADIVTTASGLQYVDIVEGEGVTPVDGGIVGIHYTGWLEDGTKFDSSIDRDALIEFALGSGYVIEGWEEGVSSMQVGGKRQLIIPAALAYGEAGYPPVIPGNATLTFDVELLTYYAPAPEAPTDVDEADITTTDSGLQYVDLVEGTGDFAIAGQPVTVHYTGWLTDTTKFDSSLDRGQSFQFQLGMGNVIPGWDEGVEGMRVGGKRQLIIPAELGYGPLGQGAIPGGATLIFEVELIEVVQPTNSLVD